MTIYRTSLKILLATYLLFSSNFVQSIRNTRWQDINRWNGQNVMFDASDVKDQARLLEDYDCNIEGQCDADKNGKETEKMIDTNEIPYKRFKSNAGLTSLAGFDKLLQMDDSKTSSAAGIVPYFHTSVIPLPCSCGSHYRLMDLGRAYLPRYLVTAVCDKDACGAGGTYRCRSRFYRVRVLKRKDAIGVNPPEREPDQVNNPLLPESLRKAWTFETFTVTVACECGP